MISLFLDALIKAFKMNMTKVFQLSHQNLLLKQRGKLLMIVFKKPSHEHCIPKSVFCNT